MIPAPRALLAVAALATLAACDGHYYVAGSVRRAACGDVPPRPLPGAQVGVLSRRQGPPRLYTSTATGDDGTFGIGLPSAPFLDGLKVNLEVVSPGCQTSTFAVEARRWDKVAGNEVELLLPCTCPVPAS